MYLNTIIISNLTVRTLISYAALPFLFRWAGNASSFHFETIHLLRKDIFKLFAPLPPPPLHRLIFSTESKQKLTFSNKCWRNIWMVPFGGFHLIGTSYFTWDRYKFSKFYKNNNLGKKVRFRQPKWYWWKIVYFFSIPNINEKPIQWGNDTLPQK